MHAKAHMHSERLQTALERLVVWPQVTKVPKDVQKERAQEAKAANAARTKVARDKNEGKTRMKGKNKAGRRHRKRQDNIIEVRCAAPLTWCCHLLCTCREQLQRRVHLV